MSHTRIGRLVLATGAVTAMVVAGIGTWAYAGHDSPPGQGWAHWKVKSIMGPSYAGLDIGKKYLGACDLERNGDGVFAQYKLVGSQQILTVGDPNGAKAGCGEVTAPRDISRFRVCEEHDGRNYCSLYWRDVE